MSLRGSGALSRSGIGTLRRFGVGGSRRGSLDDVDPGMHAQNTLV
jgi:hypothetical protein